jgi:hypothetical protein
LRNLVQFGQLRNFLFSAKSNFNGLILNVLKRVAFLENKVLVNTDWHDSSTTFMGMLLPKFFMLYFGKKPPTGNIMLEDVKIAILKVGTGYKT